MALRNFSNISPATKVNQAGGFSAFATAITVQDASVLPTAPFTAALERGVLGLEEIILVTAVNTGTNVLTVTRGYDGTVPKGHSDGVSLQHCVSAIDYAEANAHINSGNVDGIHGASGGIVDLGSDQTITGSKTFNVIPTIAAARPVQDSDGNQGSTTLVRNGTVGFTHPGWTEILAAGSGNAIVANFVVPPSQRILILYGANMWANANTYAGQMAFVIYSGNPSAAVSQGATNLIRQPSDGETIRAGAADGSGQFHAAYLTLATTVGTACQVRLVYSVNATGGAQFDNMRLIVIPVM